MNEIKIKNPKEKEKNKKKGLHFYVALGICILAVGVAAYTTYDSIVRFAGVDEDLTASKTQQKYQTYSKNSNKSATNEKNEKKEKKSIPSQTKTNVQRKPSDKDQKSISTNAEASGVIVYPTSKNIIKKYSGENPVFSKTLNDWRVHNGIDLAAEQGSKVKSITSGKVKEIFNDAMFGTTMVIEHDGGFTAYYSGLGETTLVKVDDKVEAGQEIASINNIPSESADGYHLHLSIKKDGKFVDPVEVLG